MTRAIRRLRLEKQLTLSELASAAGLSKGYVSKLELGEGNPTTNALNKLAEVLGVSPAALLSAYVPSAPQSAAGSPGWAPDSTVRAGIAAAWEAIRRCRRSNLKIREQHEHMPVRWFRALSRIYAADLCGPVAPADVQADLQQTTKGLYRELDEMESYLLLRRARRAGSRGLKLEIGPVGYVWVNEEHGLAEDLYPLDADALLRFWTKACSWVAAPPVVDELAQQDVPATEARIAPIVAQVRARFEAMLRRNAEHPANVRVAASAILEIGLRDPLLVASETKERYARFLALLERVPRSEKLEGEFRAEIENSADARWLNQGFAVANGSLAPSVINLLQILARGTLHQLELVEAAVQRQREQLDHARAEGSSTERRTSRREPARAGTRRRRPRGIGSDGRA